MAETFSDSDIEALAARIDAELAELARPPSARQRSGGSADRLARQYDAIRQASGEEPAGFLHRFLANARRDLCLPGGLLFEQWRQMRDLASKDMIKTFGGVLAGMGFAASPLHTLVVSVGVVVLHLGVKTVCEGVERGDV